MISEVLGTAASLTGPYGEQPVSTEVHDDNGDLVLRHVLSATGSRMDVRYNEVEARALRDALNDFLGG